MTAGRALSAWIPMTSSNQLMCSGQPVGPLGNFSSEPAYQTLVAPGFGKANDPKVPSEVWDASTNSGGLLYTFDVTGKSLGAMGWVHETYVFVATATTDVLSFLSQSDTPFGPALDNVAIAATPIPGAFLLFGSALAGMGFLGFRRRKLEAAA